MKWLLTVMLAATAGCTYEARLAEARAECDSYGEPIDLTIDFLTSQSVRVQLDPERQLESQRYPWEYLEFRLGTNQLGGSEALRWEWPGPLLEDFTTDNPPGTIETNTPIFSPASLPTTISSRGTLEAHWYTANNKAAGRVVKCILASGEGIPN